MDRAGVFACLVQLAASLFAIEFVQSSVEHLAGELDLGGQPVEQCLQLDFGGRGQVLDALDGEALQRERQFACIEDGNGAGGMEFTHGRPHAKARSEVER